MRVDRNHNLSWRHSLLGPEERHKTNVAVGIDIIQSHHTTPLWLSVIRITHTFFLRIFPSSVQTMQHTHSFEEYLRRLCRPCRRDPHSHDIHTIINYIYNTVHTSHHVRVKVELPFVPIAHQVHCMTISHICVPLWWQLLTKCPSRLLHVKWGIYLRMSLQSYILPSLWGGQGDTNGTVTQKYRFNCAPLSPPPGYGSIQQRWCYKLLTPPSRVRTASIIPLHLAYYTHHPVLFSLPN